MWTSKGNRRKLWFCCRHCQRPGAWLHSAGAWAMPRLLWDNQGKLAIDTYRYRICRFVSRVLPKARSKLKCKGNTFENFRVRFWRLSVLLQDSSSEACAKTCSSDPRCRFFSVNLGVACNKFNATLTWTLAGLLHAHASLQSSRINKVLVLDASCFFSIF